MNKRWWNCGMRMRITGGGALAILAALVVVVVALSVHASSNTSHSTPWYVENVATSTGHAATGEKATDAAVSYAKSMSKAFHDAASKVLPPW